MPFEVVETAVMAAKLVEVSRRHQYRANSDEIVNGMATANCPLLWFMSITAVQDKIRHGLPSNEKERLSVHLSACHQMRRSVYRCIYQHVIKWEGAFIGAFIGPSSNEKKRLSVHLSACHQMRRGVYRCIYRPVIKWEGTFIGAFISLSSNEKERLSVHLSACHQMRRSVYRCIYLAIRA